MYFWKFKHKIQYEIRWVGELEVECMQFIHVYTYKMAHAFMYEQLTKERQ